MIEKLTEKQEAAVAEARAAESRGATWFAARYLVDEQPEAVVALTTSDGSAAMVAWGGESVTVDTRDRDEAVRMYLRGEVRE